MSYSAHPFEGYFNTENKFALFETYTASYKYFFYYDSIGNLCELQVDRDDDGYIIGYHVKDSYTQCPLVDEGWTYMQVSLLDNTGEGEWPLKAYVGPDNQEWNFYSEEFLFA